MGKKSQKENVFLMQKTVFENFRNWIINNEVEAWEKSQALRHNFEESYVSLFDALPIDSKEQAIEEGLLIARKALKALEIAVDLTNVSPGHGLGHLVRDYIHIASIVKDSDIDPKQAYIGVIAGVLHDFLGCSLVERYAERKRVIRHAEAGGLLFMKIANEIGIDENVSLLVYYAIAAHTHYLNPSLVKCSDGVEREILPYKDLDDEGKPIMAIFLTRWADRLDVNGPCLVGRHYLTLAEVHEDYSSSGGFYSVKYASHMRPLLRSKEQIKTDPEGRTMREHIAMFADSQNNESPYGCHDFGKMVTLRDSYKERLFRIIAAFDSPLEFSAEKEMELLDMWTDWLHRIIEPNSDLAKDDALALKKMFSTLPVKTKQAWLNVMTVTLEEYGEWAQESQRELKSFTDEQLELPVLGNIKDII